MKQKKVDLSSFSTNLYFPGDLIELTLWYVTSMIFFKSQIPFSYNLKSFLLKFFGARVGRNVIIKQGVNIKYPWFLKIGDNVWIGENVWIENTDKVIIKNNVCISQGAMLFTGNHDYRKTTFNLFTRQIILEEGVWIGAKSIVCPGVRCKTHSILSAGSVAATDMEIYSIYQGNPAVFKKERVMQ